MVDFLLEDLAEQNRLMISDFHAQENYKILYKFLKQSHGEGYSLHDCIKAVQYATGDTQLSCETIDDLLTYLGSEL